MMVRVGSPHAFVGSTGLVAVQVNPAHTNTQCHGIGRCARTHRPGAPTSLFLLPSASTEGEVEKNEQRLIVLCLPTEIFSKRRKIYPQMRRHQRCRSHADRLNRAHAPYTHCQLSSASHPGRTHACLHHQYDDHIRASHRTTPVTYKPRHTVWPRLTPPAVKQSPRSTHSPSATHE